MEIREALRRLEDFRELEQNWDSYGGRPISPAAIDKVIDLLEGFFVTPICDGTIGITFGDEDVTLIINHDGDVMGILS